MNPLTSATHLHTDTLELPVFIDTQIPHKPHADAVMTRPHVHPHHTTQRYIHCLHNPCLMHSLPLSYSSRAAIAMTANPKTAFDTPVTAALLGRKAGPVEEKLENDEPVVTAGPVDVPLVVPFDPPVEPAT